MNLALITLRKLVTTLRIPGVAFERTLQRTFDSSLSLQ